MRLPATASIAIVKLRFASLRMAAGGCLAFLATVTVAVSARADLYYTIAFGNHFREMIPGTQGIMLGPGIDLSGWNMPGHQFEFADLSGANLTNASFAGSDLANSDFSPGAILANANLTNANLTNVNLGGARLTNANFTGAIIKGADFSTVLGFSPQLTPGQLYSTGSYANRDLTGIKFRSDELYYDLTGWNFAHQNLSDASFYGSYLTNADFTGAVVNGTDFSSAGGLYPGQGNLTASQLYSTASYTRGDLTRIQLPGNDLRGWNFANKDLSNAKLTSANLGGANFTDAIIRGVDFGPTSFSNLSLPFGPSAAQVYSTASYASGDLAGIGLVDNDLTGWNFANMNLANAGLGSKLKNTNFTGADLRGAGWSPDSTTITHNTIRPDGSIQGLALLAGEKLIVRNNPKAITVSMGASFDPAATLQFLLDDNWTSPVGFDPGSMPALNGTLDLQIASGVDPTTLLGQTFQLFDWNRDLPPDDRFTMITTKPGLRWDVSNLYSQGTVTLSAVPEPPTLVLGLLGFAALLRFRRHPYIRFRALG
jgi:uncharacterized protein YjbI with pentapeptide repeats